MDDQKIVTNALVDQISTERLSLLKSRLSVAKAWSKKPHAAWRKWIAEYNIDNFEDTAEVRDRVRIGYIFRKIESEGASIFDEKPEIFIKGRTKDFQVVEDIYNSAYDLLWDKQNLEEKIEDVGTYFGLLGMGFLTSPYKVSTKKVTEDIQTPLVDPQSGQIILDDRGLPLTKTTSKEYEVPLYDMPDATVENPFKIYFSPETIFNYILDADHCPYYFKEQVWNAEKVKAVFGKTVTASEKIYTGDSEADGEIDTEIEKGSDVVSDDLKRVKVYEYYGILPEDMAKGIVNSEWTWDKEYHIFFTNTVELKVEECPYPTKPLFILGNYGLANKFWKFGDAKHLMPLIQELEMYRSQILSHTRKMANPKPLVEMNSEVDEAAFSDPRVGRTVKYAGTPPTYLSPAPLGHEVATGIDMVRTDLEKTAGTFDLENGGSQSQVKTPRGIQVYSEAADRASRRKRKKIARFIRTVITFQFQQLALNWKPEDNQFLEIAGVEEPVTPDVLRVLGDPSLLDKVDIEVESLSLNKVQMKQDSLDLLDTALKSEAQRPGILNLELIWRDTLQAGFHKRDADRYINPEEQQQQIMQMGFRPKVAVRINADTTTPAGIQLLQNDNLLNPQQAAQDEQQAAQTQMMDHQSTMMDKINSGQPPMPEPNQPTEQQPQQVNLSQLKGGM